MTVNPEAGAANFWALALLICGGALLGLGAGGCVSADSDGKRDSTQNNTVEDPYPVTVSDKLFPFEARTQNGYRLVEYDSVGKAILTRDPAWQKFILLQNPRFGWSLDGDSNGPLLTRRRGGVVESIGVYSAGSFTGDSLDQQQEQLWFPEFPGNWTGKSWRVGNREMTVVNADTGLWLPMKENSRGYAREIETGRYRVPVAIFRETDGEVITDYSFSRGVGLVAFQRRVNGKLASSGLLNESFSILFGEKMWP